MKKFLLFAAIALQSVYAFGQEFVAGLITPPLAKQVMYGGKEGKSYAVIINTNLSKREIVKKTTDYLLRLLNTWCLSNFPSCGTSPACII